MATMEREITQNERSAYIENANTVTFNYAGKTIKKLLGSIPAYPEKFLGRDQAPEEIHQRLSAHNFLLLVNGEGGIGKTTAAAVYYHKNIDNYSHLIWLVAENGISNALLSLALELELVFGKRSTVTEKLNDTIKALMNLDKTCLLVIDNANDLHDLEQTYPLLRECSQLHLLLTTRINNFARAATYPVKHLEKADAMRLFTEYYQNHDPREDELLSQILEAVGYNTLVIELLAKNLDNFNNLLNRNYSLADLLTDIQQKGVLALSKSKAITTDYKMQTAKPEEIIAAMYDISGLTEREKILLANLAVLPAITIPFEHLQELLTGMDGLADLLLTVAQKGWVELDRISKCFKNSPVIQEIVRERNREQLGEYCRELIGNLTEKLDYEPQTGSLTEIAYDTGVAFVQYAKMVCQYLYPLSALTVLLDRLGTFYKSYGNLPQALQFFEDETKLFQELYETNPQNVGFKNGLAISYAKLGVFYREQRKDLKSADLFFHQAQSLWEELTNDFPAYVEFRDNLKRVNEILNSKLKKSFRHKTKYKDKSRNST